ncbi:MAG: aldolase/citrate lyase family protein [Victivallaceae bacterium]|nr:aldolase/citrate lyase family protein [Victivallaceae bacterium]
MNCLEKTMLSLLMELKEKYGVFQIKAEFEAEGSCMDEMMRLRDVTAAVDLPIILKLGGVEAVTDIYHGLQIGVSGIIAPMAETSFALSKFVNMIDTMVAKDNAQDIEFAFNMETLTTYRNLDEMLALPNLNILQGMTIGRVDLTASMGLSRAAVDSEEIYRICEDALRKSRAKGLKNGLGGAISAQSREFIRRLVAQNLLDKFETRKVVFPGEAVKHGEKMIDKAIEFELLWLKSKRRYYSGIKKAEENRIAMLEKRINAQP